MSSAIGNSFIPRRSRYYFLENACTYLGKEPEYLTDRSFIQEYRDTARPFMNSLGMVQALMRFDTFAGVFA